MYLSFWAFGFILFQEINESKVASQYLRGREIGGKGVFATGKGAGFSGTGAFKKEFSGAPEKGMVR